MSDELCTFRNNEDRLCAKLYSGIDTGTPQIKETPRYPVLWHPEKIKKKSLALSGHTDTARDSFTLVPL